MLNIKLSPLKLEGSILWLFLFMYILVVPIYAAVGWPNLDFMSYLTIWESLPVDAKRVGELVGVEERFLVRAMRGTINVQNSTQVIIIIKPFKVFLFPY